MDTGSNLIMIGIQIFNTLILLLIVTTIIVACIRFLKRK